MKVLFSRLRVLPVLLRLSTAALFLSSVLSAQAATTLHWLTLSDGAWPASVKKVIAAFEAENPDIKVELDLYPFRQLFETIEVRMKAQDSDVDLISVDVPLVASYTVRGYLAPLDEYFSNDEIEKTWVKPSWQAGKYKENFMAAPQSSPFSWRALVPDRLTTLSDSMERALCCCQFGGADSSADPSPASAILCSGCDRRRL